MSLFANHAGKTDPLLGLIEKSSAVSHTRLHACITFRSGAIAAAEDRAQQATGTRPDYLAQLRERFPEAKINGNI
ncbi:hypothetical protein, partial [Salmonella enterica]|uniref:hypothetical protein n=1 Tax=Salmonella enterica TaxID=28901 RepID=UPI003D2A5A83